MDNDCVVCKGKVVEDFEVVYIQGPTPLFAFMDRNDRVSKGFYCTSCGLKYQFHPKRKPLS